MSRIARSIIKQPLFQCVILKDSFSITSNRPYLKKKNVSLNRESLKILRQVNYVPEWKFRLGFWQGGNTAHIHDFCWDEFSGSTPAHSSFRPHAHCTHMCVLAKTNFSYFLTKNNHFKVHWLNLSTTFIYGLSIIMSKVCQITSVMKT